MYLEDAGPHFNWDTRQWVDDQNMTMSMDEYEYGRVHQEDLAFFQQYGAPYTYASYNALYNGNAMGSWVSDTYTYYGVNYTPGENRYYPWSVTVVRGERF